MKKTAILIYGIVGYIVGAGGFFGGLPAFLANLLGPYAVDGGPEAPLGEALLVNSALLLAFGLPHSLMARRRFKAWWRRSLPQAAGRSTYMLQAGLLSLLLVWQWRALPATLWRVEHPAGSVLLWGLFWLGWLLAGTATFLINHFELTGLQQVFAYWRGREASPPDFKTPFLYRVVRHPMQLGLLMAFWSTPHMTAGRLLFAAGMTLYMLVGLTFEERDLVRRFGVAYRRYQQNTPMLIPVPRRRRASLPAPAETGPAG